MYTFVDEIVFSNIIKGFFERKTKSPPPFGNTIFPLSLVPISKRDINDKKCCLSPIDVGFCYPFVKLKLETMCSDIYYNS